MVTPLSDGDTLDLPGLERLVEHLIAGGVSGVFILGTTGEGPSLSDRLRRELIDRTCKAARHRVPILVGITETAYAESVKLAVYAADAGADAVVLAPPHYFPISQAELLQYVRRLTGDQPLPLLLYNMPAMTKVSFEPETIRRLLDIERIIGIKDSSGDLNYFDQILELARGRPDWSVLIGPEELMAEAVQRGGQGGVNGGANLLPRLFVELYHAAAGRDAARVSLLQAQVVRFQRIYRIRTEASALIKGLKCALSVRGICNDTVAPPFYPLDASERMRVVQLLEQLERSE